MSRQTPSILNTLFRFKCPRCRRGNMFFIPFRFKTAFDMKERCDQCHLNYTPEPGYYFGAMFISYIITAWVFVTIAFGAMYFLHFNVDQALMIVIVFAMVFFVYFFRLGRSIWLAINVKYDPEWQRKYANREKSDK